MSIWDIFKKSTEEPVEKKVDPIVEQRRKEKFSTPLIYNEEEARDEERKLATSNSTMTPRRQTTTQAKPKAESNASSYVMSEIISPFYGRKEEPVTIKSKNTTPKRVVKKQYIEDQIVPVISPIYGARDYYEEVEEPNEIVHKEQVIFKKEEPIKKDVASFDLHDILKQENDNLKIVERRTGEIQLDILNTNTNSKSSVDQVDDAMTLDELMSLYERKFKDGENE